MSWLRIRGAVFQWENLMYQAGQGRWHALLANFKHFKSRLRSTKLVLRALLPEWSRKPCL
ncbi:hypothetical protein WJ13_11670 [Burkholderia seminalis]|nr:hypothetical protein WJ13_11670 [Burkholderia seminalis]